MPSTLSDIRPLQPALSIRDERRNELELLIVPQRKSVQVPTANAVQRLEIEDPQICETLQYVPGEISIVGKQPGETRVALWVTGQSAPRVFCVRVNGEMKDPSRGQKDDVALNRLIAELYPRSQIKLISGDDKLIVQGQAKDRQEAIQILSFIRSVRLIPVVDHVQIRNR
jgi:Flp pilus assembly secretin CpaC